MKSATAGMLMEGRGLLGPIPCRVGRWSHPQDGLYSITIDAIKAKMPTKSL